MDYRLKDFKKIIKRSYQETRRQLSPLHTDCMRVYDRNISEYPVTIDVYGNYVKIQEFGETASDSEVIVDAVSRMLYIPSKHIVYQVRKKRTGREQHSLQIKDKSRIGRISVMESGLTFSVDLETRIDAGLFLDHMPTRVMVRDNAFGRNVLNLFSYTGSFSVYAAAGGARQVVSVDLSNTYLQWAEEHLSMNGFTGSRYPCVRSDVKEFLLHDADNYGPFDIIIMDPPSFSNSNKMDGTFDVQRDYVWYIDQAMRHLSSTGILLFSTNLDGFHFDPGRIGHAVCRNITNSTIPPGFSKRKRPHICWMIQKLESRKS